MKTMRAVLSFFALLGLLAFTTTLARAGDVDCTTAASACGFGTLLTTVGGTLTGSGHSVDFIEQVYQQGGVYTYVFQLTNKNNAHGGIDFANLFTDLGGFGDNFNCGDGSCLNYGVVHGGITAASDVNDKPEGHGFHFNDLSFTIDFGKLKNGKNFTFYLQGGAYTTGTCNAGNGGSTTNSANCLTPASEPGVIALLGSSLLLFGGILFVGRLRSLEA